MRLQHEILRDRPRRYLLLIVIAVLAVVGLLTSHDAIAVDGNYSSPYSSQWEARSTTASIPDETLLGILLVIVNTMLASFFFLRDKLRRRQRPA